MDDLHRKIFEDALETAIKSERLVVKINRINRILIVVIIILAIMLAIK